MVVRIIFGPEQDILVLIAYALMPLINASVDVSSKNRGLIFVGVFIYIHSSLIQAAKILRFFFSLMRYLSKFGTQSNVT